jgi:hypothetical protein
MLSAIKNSGLIFEKKNAKLCMLSTLTATALATAIIITALRYYSIGAGIGGGAVGTQILGMIALYLQDRKKNHKKYDFKNIVELTITTPRIVDCHYEAILGAIPKHKTTHLERQGHWFVVLKTTSTAAIPQRTYYIVIGNNDKIIFKEDFYLNDFERVLREKRGIYPNLHDLLGFRK